MKPEDENIETLARAILRDAEAEVAQIQSQARTKADEIRQRAQQAAHAERESILHAASQEADRLRGQAAATAQLKARTLQLEHRERLLNQAFDAARQRLGSVQKRADYDQIAAQLLREALIQLKAGSAEVHMDQGTQKSLTAAALERISKELNSELSIGGPLESGTGVVVDASDGRLHYDNTLETRLTRLQSALRSPVFQVLMGEKL